MLLYKSLDVMFIIESLGNRTVNGTVNFRKFAIKYSSVGYSDWDFLSPHFGIR